jgi:hypothetical protein
MTPTPTPLDELLSLMDTTRANITAYKDLLTTQANQQKTIADTQAALEFTNGSISSAVTNLDGDLRSLAQQATNSLLTP